MSQQDRLADDLTNGSAMPILTDTQESDLRLAQRAPWVRPILTETEQHNLRMAQEFRVRPPAVIDDGMGALAVAGAMRSLMAPAHSMHSEHIEWCLPDPKENHFDHCCRIIDNISVGFYIGITEDPNSRWLQHSASQTVGHEPTMIVLIEAVSSRVTAAMEVRLLQRYLHMMRCTNQSSGGERASAQSPHYLYVLKASPPLLRSGR